MVYSCFAVVRDIYPNNKELRMMLGKPSFDIIKTLVQASFLQIKINKMFKLTLPNSINYDGYVIIVKDEGGYAKKHRIRLTPSSGTIEGTTYVDMNLNYISLQMIARNNNWWII
jgi:hypothetical protein